MKAVDVVTLCQRLVRARTVMGNEGAAADVAEEAMRDLGYDEVWRDDLGNLMGAIGGGRHGAVLLDGHLDVVDAGDLTAWRADPFAGEVIDGALWGRGAVDMKGPLAAMIVSAAALRDRPRRDRRTVYVSCTVAEETVEGLALRPVLERLRPDAVIIGEPTSGKVAVAQRGRAEIALQALGRAAHSAYPEEGRNSAEAMADLIVALRGVTLPVDDLLGPASFVLIEVTSLPSPSSSTIPHLTRAVYDRRLLPGETPESVLAPLRAIAERQAAERQAAERHGSDRPIGANSKAYQVAVARAELVTYTGLRLAGEKFAPGWKLPRDHPLIEASLRGLRAAGLPGGVKIYATCTNGSASAGWLGIPTVGYGPGENERSHTTNEAIGVPDLEQGVQGFAALAWEAATMPSLPRLEGRPS